MYRSMLTGQCTDLCWPACLPPALLILVQPRHRTAGRQCRNRPMLASRSSASIVLILVKPYHKIAGQYIALCWADCLLPVCLILVQPRPKIAGFVCQYFLCWSNRGPKLPFSQCIAHARSCVLKSWSRIRFPPATTK